MTQNTYIWLQFIFYVAQWTHTHTKKNKIDLAIHFDIVLIRIGTEFILNYDVVWNFNCPYHNSVVNATKPKKTKEMKENANKHLN